MMSPLSPVLSKAVLWYLGVGRVADVRPTPPAPAAARPTLVVVAAAPVAPPHPER